MSSHLQDGNSVVIPVYNSASSLNTLVQRVGSVLATLGGHYELILVNDGSPDQSWKTICELGTTFHWVRAINLTRNYGQHNALLCGLRAAMYKVSITLDDDLQHPPEEIPTLLNALTPDCDVVYGVPQRQQHGLRRDLASRVTKFVLQTAMGAQIARDVSAFRVFRTQLRDAFANYKGSFVSIDVLLTWATTRFIAVPVRHEPRLIGVSNYTFRRLLTHAVNMVTGFSTVHLQIATFVGFTFTLFGVGVFAFVIGRYLLQGGSVPGFTFLASVISIFSGAQLFTLGIIGEYLARIHFRSMERPVYAIRERMNFTDESAERP